MGLFTDPQVINDGVTAHSFVKRGQLPSPKSLITEYFEPAAMATEEKITVKYEATNSPAQRSVLSSTCIIDDPDGVPTKCTINTSVAYDKKVDLAVVEDKLDLHCAALAISGMRTRFLQRMP